MGQLVVLGFDGLTAADEVLNKVRGLKAEHLIDLEDAVVVERDAEGKVTSAAIHHRPLPMVLRFSAELGDRLSGVLSGEHFVAP